MASMMIHLFLNFFKRVFGFIEEIFSASVICRFTDYKDLKIFEELYLDDKPKEKFSIKKFVVIILKGIVLFIFVLAIPCLIIFFLKIISS